MTAEVNSVRSPSSISSRANWIARSTMSGSYPYSSARTVAVTAAASNRRSAGVSARPLVAKRRRATTLDHLGIAGEGRRCAPNGGEFDAAVGGRQADEVVAGALGETRRAAPVAGPGVVDSGGELDEAV